MVQTIEQKECDKWDFYYCYICICHNQSALSSMRQIIETIWVHTKTVTKPSDTSCQGSVRRAHARPYEGYRSHQRAAQFSPDSIRSFEKWTGLMPSPISHYCILLDVWLSLWLRTESFTVKKVCLVHCYVFGNNKGLWHRWIRLAKTINVSRNK